MPALTNKATLRRHFTQLRRQTHLQKDLEPFKNLLSLKKFLEKKRLLRTDWLLSYSPIGAEIRPNQLLSHFVKPHIPRFFLPDFHPADLGAPIFYEAFLSTEEHADALKFEEKKPRISLNLRQLLPGMTIIAFVPLLAFDASGNRLGRGAGYYDRALQEIRKKVIQFNKQATLIPPLVSFAAVGLAYDQQYCPSLLPTQAHDQRLDHVFTPTRIWSF